MKLKSIAINSYRSCIKTKLPIHDELTGLIGVNGAGKSNILNAILLLKKMYRQRSFWGDIGNSPLNPCSLASEFEHEGKILFFKADFILETDERNIDEVRLSQIKVNFRQFTDYLKWVTIPVAYLSDLPRQLFPYKTPSSISKFGPRMNYVSSKDMRLIQKNKVMNLLLSQLASIFNGINYYGASQFSDPSQCPVSIEFEENRPIRKSRGNTPHDQFILDLYRSSKAKNSQYKRYKNVVGKDGIGLVDDISFLETKMPSSYLKVRTGGKVQKINRNKLLVVPIFSVNNTELSPNQLSEGTFKTLALIFYILTDESKLLLIEEPEVCVHHGLLNSVISLVKSQSKHKQVIMSTHSDFVLDHLDPDNLVLVKWKTSWGTDARALNKTMSKNDFKALRDYLKETGNLGEYWREGGFEND